MHPKNLYFWSAFHPLLVIMHEEDKLYTKTIKDSQ